MITDQLRMAVKYSGKSVLKVAEESGIGQSMLNRFVNGRRDIYLATAERLAAYFGLELRPIEPADVQHAGKQEQAVPRPARKPKSKRRPKSLQASAAITQSVEQLGLHRSTGAVRTQ